MRLFRESGDVRGFWSDDGGPFTSFIQAILRSSHISMISVSQGVGPKP